ncbi:GNAT family N-acetyltransferase [Dickeya dadantii]|uniref:GCN5-related N-acetyltransferase n=1 Tax=Dickeya dadantii (strain 3937) TaxID=198628 RepID=E0SIG3_DICD3|nr:GNAT family N-acetyltransferase [Dickeya dadantii]ADM97844.1 GCN5-related N-acetyltransferase [Dickeya dadantii 3937]NAT78542.1 N-acetyltransferase [Dickeya dadantii]NPE50759.1 N-acetyltransferase family protein [Dickeya dadantii]NPE55021.1 N-acetyltransferase [Dickeya dadantii]NPE60983.1 N-acetyltransferase [Dickeya dadantii]
MIIRDAKSDDLETVADIYNHAVLNTTAIFNDTTVDVANRAIWLADRTRLGYPVLVALSDDGSVMGYASFGDWRAFDGYRHTVEHSVYVHIDHRGKGIAEALMKALIERARAIGKHSMVAGIESKNAASIRLHEKLGFGRVDPIPQVGMKFGQWLDLTFMFLILDDRPTPN